METLKAFAERLNGRVYKDEITQDEIDLAEKLGYVVVLGKSDDSTVFYGGIDQEYSMQGSGRIYLTQEGIFVECDCNCIHSQKAKERASYIDVYFVKGRYVWSYKTEIPHETFEIFDNQPSDNLKFCQGMVFKLKSLSS